MLRPLKPLPPEAAFDAVAEAIARDDLTFVFVTMTSLGVLMDSFKAAGRVQTLQRLAWCREEIANPASAVASVRMLCQQFPRQEWLIESDKGKPKLSLITSGVDAPGIEDYSLAARSLRRAAGLLMMRNLGHKITDEIRHDQAVAIALDRLAKDYDRRDRQKRHDHA